MKLDHSILVFLFVDLVVGFLPPSMGSSRNRVALSEQEEKRGFFGSISNFFEELDAFVDDATSRRLGAGSAFYGKRKSSFYGKNDKNKKQDRNVPSPTEDYQGPAKSGYFQWQLDEESGQMKPVTRLKKRNIERNPNYWDRVFGEEEE